MGWIANRLSGAPPTEARDWLTDDDSMFEGAMTSAGVRVTPRSALTLSTVYRIYDLLASSVAMAPKDIIIKVRGASFPEYDKPRWMSLPDPRNPNYTERAYFMQVALSLLFDGNYFTTAFPNVVDPQVLTVLPPSRVDVVDVGVYDIKDAAGHTTRRLGPAEIIHGAWIVPPGELRGIAPLEMLRRGVGGAIAAEDFGARFFGQGASMSFGVEVPGQLDGNQKQELRDNLKKRYTGLHNSHAIGVLTGGAKFVSGLQPTPEQAQMLETRKFYVEDLARAFGIPPGLLGSQEPGASSYASATVYDMQFKERAVLPLANRIEDGHDRLVEVLPAAVRIPGASAQFKVNLDSVARVDILTRAQAYNQLVLAGVMKPSEARVKEDLPPAAGADRLFMQSQMVPIDQIGVTPAAPAARSEESAA